MAKASKQDNICDFPELPYRQKESPCCLVIPIALLLILMIGFIAGKAAIDCDLNTPPTEEPTE